MSVQEDLNLINSTSSVLINQSSEENLENTAYNFIPKDFDMRNFTNNGTNITRNAKNFRI